MKTRNAPSMRGSGGMVSSQSDYASAIGVEILKQGGNAFDAATAVAYALSVSEPQASGLGGQSMALIYHAKEDRYFALDGSSFAPYHYQPNHANKRHIYVGLKASTLPSTVAFFGYLHDRYGTLTFEQCLEGAKTLALEGVTVSPLLASLIKKHQSVLSEDALIEKRFFHNQRPLREGETLVQPELANCIETLGKKGWRDFYTGSVAKSIIKDMHERSGWLREEDFLQIPIPVERSVIEGKYRAFKLITFPPPGAGRVLIQIMQILNAFEKASIDLDTPLGNAIIALAFQLTLRDRAKMPQNPDIYFQQVSERMTDLKHAKKMHELIKRIVSSFKQQRDVPIKTAGETTHFNVVDNEGNTVAVTQSIERVFGAKRMNHPHGFFYNNYMSAFEMKDRTHPYFLLPRNRPFSSVAPTIITRRGKPICVLGSPGSERISTALAQVLVRYLDFNEPLAEAIEKPRFHTSARKQMQLEQERFDDSIKDNFEALGFDMKARDSYSFYLGCVQAIEFPHKKNGYTAIGVADPRRDGDAIAVKPKGKQS